MSLHEVMQRALEDHDTVMCRRLWKHVAPNMPQPQSELEAEIIMHRACTQANNVKFESRAYSHRWLIDHGYPSGLPNYLCPRAERIYPKIVDAVGIAVSSMSDAMLPITLIIRKAMEDVVLEHYADNNKDPNLIRKRMLEARDSTVKKLVG